MMLTMTRNFTTYQYRFRMPGSESGGVGNFWYSFDYGLAHFISLDVETDYPNSPEYPFARDLTGSETLPQENETYVTDSGPFGTVGNYTQVKTYQQYQWLQADLAKVNRSVTPWIIINAHRPMYSSGVSSYQRYIRNAFEALMLQYGVDLYIAGHIHWYERMYPLGNSTIDSSSIINQNTYRTNPGVSMTHIVNGQAGNIESHSELSSTESVLNITAVLNTKNYGFTKFSFLNSTVLETAFIEGDNGTVGDTLTLIKKAAASTASTATSLAHSSSVGSAVSSGFAPTATTGTSSAHPSSGTAASGSSSTKSASASGGGSSTKSASASGGSSSAKSASASSGSSSAKSASATSGSSSVKSASASSGSSSAKSASGSSTTAASQATTSSAGAPAYSGHEGGPHSYGWGWSEPKPTSAAWGWGW